MSNPVCNFPYMRLLAMGALLGCLGLVGGCSDIVNIRTGSVGVVTRDGVTDHREIAASSRDLVQGKNGREIAVYSVEPYDIEVLLSGRSRTSGALFEDIIFTTTVRVDPNRVAELHKTYPNDQLPVDGAIGLPGKDYFTKIINRVVSLRIDELATGLEAESIHDLQGQLLRMLISISEEANSPMLQFVYPVRARVRHGIKQLKVDNSWGSNMPARLNESERYPVVSAMTTNRFMTWYVVIAVLGLGLIAWSKGTNFFGIGRLEPVATASTSGSRPAPPPPLKTEQNRQAPDDVIVKNKRKVTFDD